MSKNLVLRQKSDIYMLVNACHLALIQFCILLIIAPTSKYSTAPKFSKESNVAMAHPTAAELLGMTCHRFATHFSFEIQTFHLLATFLLLNSQMCFNSIIHINMALTLKKVHTMVCPNRSRAAGYND